ncbi:MAG: hypothetical protein ABI794_18190 [Betaproteobacteria bacterium]
MPLPVPSPKTDVPRDAVAQEIELMLFDDRVRWIAVEFESSGATGDFFRVTPWTTDPTGG